MNSTNHCAENLSILRQEKKFPAAEKNVSKCRRWKNSAKSLQGENVLKCHQRKKFRKIISQMTPNASFPNDRGFSLKARYKIFEENVQNDPSGKT